VTVACSLITLTHTEPYMSTEKIEGVQKQEMLVQYGWGQMGGWKDFSFGLSEADTINIYYRTGINQLPNSPLIFAIVDEVNYTGFSTMDEILAHSKYVVVHPSGEQIENWNWTVPYDSAWHFIFDFRQTFREDVYVKLIRHYIGTEYREVTNYRDVEKPIIPYHYSYIGIGLSVIGAAILVYGFKEGIWKRESDKRAEKT
jgi:hypothetical protein